MQAAIEDARLGLAEGGIPISSVIVHRGRFAVYYNVEEAWRIADHVLKGEMPVPG